ILSFNNFGLVTMNGSHEFVEINLGNWEIRKRIPSGTSGGEGPRETAYDQATELTVATTYAGDVRFLDPDLGDVHVVIPTGGKSEGIAILDGKIFAANAFEVGGFTPEKTVAVIDLSTVSVERTEGTVAAVTLEQNVPNPVRDRTMISF